MVRRNLYFILKLINRLFIYWETIHTIYRFIKYNYHIKLVNIMGQIIIIFRDSVISSVSITQLNCTCSITLTTRLHFQRLPTTRSSQQLIFAGWRSLEPLRASIWGNSQLPRVSCSGCPLGPSWDLVAPKSKPKLGGAHSCLASSSPKVRGTTALESRGDRRRF